MRFQLGHEKLYFRFLYNVTDEASKAEIGRCYTCNSMLLSSELHVRLPKINYTITFGIGGFSISLLGVFVYFYFLLLEWQRGALPY